MLNYKDLAQTSIYVENAIKVVFKTSIILVTILLIISLILWLIGIKIKSEKAIKKGIRLSLSMLYLEFLMFGIVIFIAKI